jgi:hypothetical protein
LAKSTHNEDFVALDLEVVSLKSGQSLEGSVTYYLHPTFDRAIMSAGMIERRATVTCFALDGFTVGTETSGTRLELDLAADTLLISIES